MIHRDDIRRPGGRDIRHCGRHRRHVHGRRAAVLGRQGLGRQGAHHPRRSARWRARGRAPGARQGGDKIRGGVRPLCTCHNDRDQCADRAKRAKDRSARHARLPRCPHHPQRAPLRHVRSADRIPRTARSPRPDVRDRGADAGRRYRVSGAQQGQRACDHRRAQTPGCAVGGRLSPQRVPQRPARTTTRAVAEQRASRRVSVAVVRGVAADPGISARFDHSDQRLHHADREALSHAPCARGCGRRLSEQAADHAVERRIRRDRHGRASSGAHDRERPGGGCAGGQSFRTATGLMRD